MTARPMTEEERAEALQRCLWFVINVAPEYAYGAWAELEPQARALLSSSSAERVMREALEACAAPWDSGETTVPNAITLLSAEFQRRLNIAGEALAVLSKSDR